MQNRIVPVDRLTALQREVAMLRKQNYEIAGRERRLRQELDVALRNLAAHSKCTQAANNSSNALLASSSSGTFPFPGIFRRLKPRSQIPNLKPLCVEQDGDYNVLLEENAKLRATIAQLQTPMAVRKPDVSVAEDEEDRKMEELVKSFDIAGKDGHLRTDLPIHHRQQCTTPHSIRLPHIHHQAGGDFSQMQNAPVQGGSNNTHSTLELDRVKAELARALEKIASLQSEMDRVIIDYCAALDLMRDLKEYGEEKRRIADIAINEKEEQSRAHEHACNQLRNAHHTTLSTVRSGLAAHITSLEAELQKAGVRIRDLEAAVTASASFCSALRTSSTSPPQNRSAASVPCPHHYVHYQAGMENSQDAFDRRHAGAAVVPNVCTHAGGNGAYCGVPGLGVIAASAGLEGEGTLFEEITREFENRVRQV